MWRRRTQTTRTSGPYVLRSPRLDLSNFGACAVSFMYHMRGADVGSLAVRTWDGAAADNFTTVRAPRRGDQGGGRRAAAMMPLSTRSVEFVAYTGDGWAGDIALDDVAILEAPTPAPTLSAAPTPAPTLGRRRARGRRSCCRRVRLRGRLLRLRIRVQLRGARHAGTTGYGLTGPHADHGNGTSRGHFVYVESAVAELPRRRPVHAESPSFDGGEGVDLEVMFWYHLYGAEMGALALDASNGTHWSRAWSASGDHGDEWRLAEVGVRGGTTKVRFVGKTGGGPTSDMALDDIAVVLAPTPMPSATFAPTYSVAPSPAPTTAAYAEPCGAFVRGRGGTANCRGAIARTRRRAATRPRRRRSTAATSRPTTSTASR